MAAIYAALIIKGKKTFSDVPAKLQEQVRAILEDIGGGSYISESDTKSEHVFLCDENTEG